MVLVIHSLSVQVIQELVTIKRTYFYLLQVNIIEHVIDIF